MQVLVEKMGCVLMKPRLIEDERGWFQIPFNIDDIRKLGLFFNNVCQLNHSLTMNKGIVRGPNFQVQPYNQTKVVRVVKGSIYSVAIDINPDSLTFGKAVGFHLSAENKYIMYIPNTFAHGFTVLEDLTEMEYFTDNIYCKDNAKSIFFDDKNITDFETGLSIDWSFGDSVLLSDVKSEKNANAPTLKEFINRGLL